MTPPVMTVEEALAVLKAILGQESLNEIQKTVFRASWEQKTYPEMATSAGYDDGYIKYVGFQLWKTLSAALGERVTKDNVRSVLTKWRERNAKENFTESIRDSGENSGKTTSVSEADAPSCQDWGEAIDVSVFYGRSAELATLEQWMIQQRCRLVALLGIGGMGKTALSVKLAEQVGEQFEYVIWRSLQNAPSLDSLLASAIQFLSHQQETELPADVSDRISRLLDYLQKHRCLIVLDNAETILHGTEASETKELGYSELFKRIGSEQHQSCLVLTSREKPKEVAALEGEALPIRSLKLYGLTVTDAQAIFKNKGNFSGSLEAWQTLIQSYAGNPLALKIIATTIRDLFNSDISRFLAQGTVVFGDIQDLLDQQFSRLSSIEKEIMHWLAINREPVEIKELQSDLLSPVLPSDLVEALESLVRRCLIDKATPTLIEKSATTFTLQPVLMEYVTNQLLKGVCQEIETQTISTFQRYALIKAQAKDYIKESQIRLILQPLTEQLIRRLGAVERIENHLTQILSFLRGQLPIETGYAGGNVINLLRQLHHDLSGYDFSKLTIWQADLKGVYLRQADFSGCDLSKSSFTENFAHIYSLAVSPDGQLIATSDTHGEICLRHISKGKPFLSWEAHTGVVRSIAFSPDGQTLMSGGDDQLVNQWDIRTGQCCQTLREHQGTISSLAFSPDIQILASSSTDCTVKLWDVKTGQCLRTQQEHFWWVMSLTFSPDGRLLAGGNTSGSIELWDAETGQSLKTLRGHPDTFIPAICFSRDGQTLISGGMDRMLRLWEIETGQCKREVQAHQGWVWWVACSPDGYTIASSSADQTIKLWEMETGELLRTLQGHEYGVRVVLFSSDCQTLVSSDEGQTLKVWDIPTGQCLKTSQGYSSGVWAIAFSPDGRTLVSNGEDQTVKLWDVQRGCCLKTLRGHTVWVRSVAYSPDGETVASCGADCLVKLWSVSTGQCLRTFQGHTSFAWSLAYSPDGQTLASCGIDQSVRIWDVNTGQCLKVLDHTSPATAVVYSPDGNSIASYGVEQSVRIWDTNTGHCLKVIQGNNYWVLPMMFDWVCSVAFSPDGQTIAASSKNYLIQIWDVATGQCRQVLRGHTSSVLALAYSRDGRRLASASMDQTVRVWDAETGQCLRMLEGHTKWVYSVAFTVLYLDSEADATPVLASSSEDRTIRFWEVETGKCLKILRSERPYEGMKIAGAVGLSEAQKATLFALGAIEGVG